MIKSPVVNVVADSWLRSIKIQILSEAVRKNNGVKPQIRSS